MEEGLKFKWDNVWKNLVLFADLNIDSYAICYLQLYTALKIYHSDWIEMNIVSIFF